MLEINMNTDLKLNKKKLISLVNGFKEYSLPSPKTFKSIKFYQADL